MKLTSLVPVASYFTLVRLKHAAALLRSFCDTCSIDCVVPLNDDSALQINLITFVNHYTVARTGKDRRPFLGEQLFRTTTLDKFVYTYLIN